MKKPDWYDIEKARKNATEQFILLGKPEKDKKLEWYRQALAHSHLRNRELEDMLISERYDGYKQGWIDCEKKIKNFMIRHCERWKEE